MGRVSVIGDLPTGAKAVTLLVTPDQGISPVIGGDDSTTRSPASQADATLVTQRSSKMKLHILRLRSEVGVASHSPLQSIHLQHEGTQHRYRVEGMPVVEVKKRDADHSVQASRKLQRLPILKSDSEQAGGHTLELDNDAEDFVSEDNFRIKTAPSMPIALQGASDAAGRDMRSPGAERSIHSSSSAGMSSLISS